MAETALFDYALTKTKVTNPDHTHAAVVTDCTPVTVPGSTPYGPISDALVFGASSSIVAPFPTASVDAKRFTVRVIFRVTSAVTTRQNLVESTCLPFSVHLLPGSGATTFQAVGTVNNVRNGWSGAATLERIALQLNHWYALDLVYDIDTLALFVDKQRIAVSTFPSGALAPLVAGELVLGVHPDKVRFHFIGDMARAQVFADIPEDLEAREDESRATAEWHIRLKENEVAGTIDLGDRQGDVAYRSTAGIDVQRFERGLIGYTDGYPAAFALHGGNYQRYLAGNLDWDCSSVPWIITVFDPNQQNSKQKISISPPPSNAFYFTSAGLTYGGGPGTGAIGYVPFSSVNHRQASPVWDPTLLLLAGLVVALGADGSTESITDSAGNNLWLNANFSGDPKTYAGQFWTVGALDGRMDGELLLRRIRRSRRFWNTARSLSMPVSALLSAMVHPQDVPEHEAEINPQPLPPRLATLLAQSDLSEAVLSRSLQELAADSLASSGRKEGHRSMDDSNASDFPSGDLRPNTFGSAIGVAIDSLRRQSSAYGGDYKHVVRGRRRGQFNYALRYKLAETRLLAAMDRGEAHIIDASGVGGSQPIMRIVAGRDKTIQIEHVSRIGMSSDFMRLRISNLPLRAGLDMNVSVRPGLAAVDVLTGGQRVDANIDAPRGRSQKLQLHLCDGGRAARASAYPV